MLGASFGNLLQLLSKEYLILIAVATVLTLPIVYFAMNQWLQDYTFRIDLGLWFAIIPVFLILSLALISIISRIAQAAKRNPVESLRYK